MSNHVTRALPRPSSVSTAPPPKESLPLRPGAGPPTGPPRASPRVVQGGSGLTRARYLPLLHTAAGVLAPGAMARLAVRALLAVKFNSTEEAAEADFKHGALSVVADSSTGEAAFHKFLAVDAAPIGWGCTLLASIMAAVQVRVVVPHQAAGRGTRHWL